MCSPVCTVAAGVLLLLCATLALIPVRRPLWHTSTTARLPPGPRGHWLTGNKIPPHPWRTFYEYTLEYGPLFSLRLHRQLWVVIGSYDAAYELMDRRGASFADRPKSIAAGEIMSGGKRILLVPQGERMKKLRRALHTYLQPKRAAEYEILQAKASRNLVLDIISRPNAFQNHTKRYAASVIISLTYGKASSSSYEDPEVLQIQSFLNALGMALKPGRYAIDSYPLLRYLPGYASKLKLHHRQESALFLKQYWSVKDKLNLKGDANVPPSFAKSIIENQQTLSLNDHEAAYLCGSMFGAGSDTTAAAIMVVIMAAACFPDKQRIAQQQLDLVVGEGRLPSFSDYNDLPYIRALVLESYRWRPVSAGGFAHRATEDVIYSGYLIPKGTTVVGNHWAIMRDPAMFPNPEEFKPERWLDEDGRIREDLRNFNFGFGRRVCPGMHVANNSLFINSACILWAFKIEEDALAPINRMGFTDTANSHPLPFKAVFTDRFTRMRQVVEDASELAY